MRRVIKIKQEKYNDVAFFSKPQIEVKAGTNVISNIAFNTVINVHPKADPREPQGQDDTPRDAEKPKKWCGLC